MSLSTQLHTMLGSDVAKEVLELVNKNDSMKKYLSTDKGKAARLRANQKYYDKHGKLIKGDAEDVWLQLENIYEDILWESAKIDESDESVLARVKLDPFLYRTGTQLWRSYCETDGFPHMTRVRYLTLLPKWTIEPWFMRDGKKVYTPVYAVNLLDFYKESK